MTGAHQASGLVTIAATVLLGLAAAWSVVASRSSMGQRDHRHAVDRAVIVLFWAFVLAVALGLGSLVAGPGPSDGLHLLYGLAGPSLLVGAVVVTRTRQGWTRQRMDGVMLLAALVLVGIDLRLFMTG